MEAKTLAAKMAAIMGDVPTMIKNGRNDAQKYAYVTAEDVKAAIRPLLKKHKVAIFSSMLDVQRDTAINRNNTTVVTVIAKMCFTVVCGETGEKIDCLWYGESNDYADKAVNKAATAAEKYWLINTFLLSTSEPDADEETITTDPQPAAEIIKPSTVETIETLGAQYYPAWNKKRAGFVRYVTERRTADIMELTEAEGQTAIKGLRSSLATRQAEPQTEAAAVEA